MHDLTVRIHQKKKHNSKIHVLSLMWYFNMTILKKVSRRKLNTEKMLSLTESINNRLFWYSETSVTIKFFDAVANLFSLLSTILKISMNI